MPSSSVRHQSDAGTRAHTNHLIYAGPPLQRPIDPPFEQSSFGPSTRFWASEPQGYSPEDLLAAYHISPSGGSGAIAVIDAYHYPTALNDFNSFSQQFDLPQETSSDPLASSNQVFQVVYQGSSAPTGNPSWNQESALDIEWAHALARHAKIYMVEANSDDVSDLFAAVAKAKTLPGVREISMSFGTGEFKGEQTFDSLFVQSGISFFAAAGDSAGITEYPAWSPNVVGVGGTTLLLSTSQRVVSESAWNGTGGGSSPYEPIPSYQAKIASIVGSFRGGPDVALDGDPNTGVAVYDTTSYQGMSGWMVIGGTSLATPCVAAIANTSERRLGSALELEHIYQGLGRNFRDIISGGSGPFSAKVGWDFCTGVGCPLFNAGV